MRILALIIPLLFLSAICRTDESPPFEVKDPAATENFRSIYYGLDQSNATLTTHIASSFKNIKESPYNAKGDGITDDSDAFQYFLTNASTGSVLWIPNGTYKVTKRLTFNANRLTLWGESTSETLINFTAPSANTSLFFSDGTHDHITYRNLELQLANASSFTGISGTQHNAGDTNITWDNVTFSRFNRAAINLGLTTLYITIQNCRFLKIQDTSNTFLATAILTDGSNTVLITNNRFSENDRDIFFPGGTSVFVDENNTFEVGGDSGNTLIAQTSLFIGIKQLSITNNYFEGNITATGGGVVEVSSCTGVTIHNNMFNGQDANIDKSDQLIRLNGFNKNVSIRWNSFLEPKSGYVMHLDSAPFVEAQNRYLDSGIEVVRQDVGTALSSAATTAVPCDVTGNNFDLVGVQFGTGTWNLAMQVLESTNSASVSVFNIGISTEQGNNFTTSLPGDNLVVVPQSANNTSSGNSTAGLSNYIKTLTSNATCYLKVRAVYVGGTPTARGRLTGIKIAD